MAISLRELRELQQQLPKLVFIPSQDSLGSSSALAQAYLNEYHINFVQEFSDLIHGFGFIDSQDFRIAVHYWLPPNPRGTLFLVHGYYDHVGIYQHPIGFALANNLAVLAFDLPGHGLSSGEPAAIDSFNQYGSICADILRQSKALMPQPVFALGQSTGSAVLMNYLWQHAKGDQSLEQFAKILLCSPLILPCGWRGYAMGRFVYQVLRHFTNTINRSHGLNSHNEEFIRFIRHADALQAKCLSLRWVGAMKQWHRMFTEFPTLSRSALVVQGTGDTTVDWRYNIPLIQEKLPNASVVYVTDARHQLINESDVYRQKVFNIAQHYFFN